MIDHGIINKTNNNEELNKNIEDCLSNGYLLQHTTLSLQKEKVLIEAQKLYNSMFTIGKTFICISPYARDLKLSLFKYQKYQFKQKLNQIFRFNIKSNIFDKDNQNETEYEKINRKFYENMGRIGDSKKKEDILKEIQKDYHENEVNSSWILFNEFVGIISRRNCAYTFFIYIILSI